jgi:hypothetical protein
MHPQEVAMKCPRCGVALETEITPCPHCGVEIDWVSDPAQNVPDDEAFVTVMPVWDAAALPVIESLLTAEGIPYMVANETVQDFLFLGRLPTGYNMGTGPPVIRVPREHAEAARELLEKLVPLPEDQEVKEQT